MSVLYTFAHHALIARLMLDLIFHPASLSPLALKTCVPNFQACLSAPW